jgi:excisionase family DNA binding protein
MFLLQNLILILLLFNFVDINFYNMLKQNNVPQWLTKKDLTRYLPISTRSVENYVRRGLFKAYRIGGKVLFNREEIDNCILKSGMHFPLNPNL